MNYSSFSLMKQYFFLFFFLSLNFASAQEKIVNSFDGWQIEPHGTYRLLNLLINIHYDQNRTANPITDSTQNWLPGRINSINDAVPTYLNDLLDSKLADGQYPRGSMTCIFYESSFGSLIVLGDFVVVNIAQSRITSGNSSGFSLYELIKQAVTLINESDGLRAVYHNNSITDYDANHDNKIDFLQILLRNTTVQYGGIGSGQGQTGNLYSDIKIKIGDQYFPIDIYSAQFVGDANMALNLKSALIHEFSHNLFGTNAAHSSGGHHYRVAQAGTFLGVEGGYGLMGAANSGLVSCNAYERWRMNWTSPTFNQTNFPIAADNQNSDIKKADGAKQFVLRDFVSTGDAIRIELPYCDSNAYKQYLWLENHQVGKNGKLDFLNHSNKFDCRSSGGAGIYAFIEVGNAVRSGTYNQVYQQEADFLKIVSAEGNWDYEQQPPEFVDCVAYGPNGYKAKRVLPNPFTGEQDQSTIFFADTSNVLNLKHGKLLYIVEKQNGEINRDLPHLGDSFDAFTDSMVLGIATNPAAVNTLTYYMNSYNGKDITALNNQKNWENIYLSGLEIKMTENLDHSFTVNVQWDKYNVNQDIRWTGNIILQENLNLQPSTTLLLDQSFTPQKHIRDSITHLFASPTTFICKSGSKMVLHSKSRFIIRNGSKLVVEQNAELSIEKGAVIIIEKGSFIDIQSGASVSNRRRIKNRNR